MSAAPSRQLQTKQIQDMERWRKAVRHAECQLVDSLQVNDVRKEKAEWDGYVFGMKCPTRLIFPTLAYEIAITAPEWRR